MRVSAGLLQHIRSWSENSDSGGRQRVRCGSRSHPWLLEAQTGQQVNISLLDFSAGRTQLTDTRDDCSPAHSVQYGYIVDKTNKNNVSICSTDHQHRHKHLYMSRGSFVEIVLTAHNASNFLVAFQGWRSSALCIEACLFSTIIGTARRVCRPGSMKRYAVSPSLRLPVRPSVPLSDLAWAYSSKPAAAGLLLRAKKARDIDRLLLQRRANADSATLSAYIGSTDLLAYLLSTLLHSFL